MNDDAATHSFETHTQHPMPTRTKNKKTKNKHKTTDDETQCSVTSAWVTLFVRVETMEYIKGPLTSFGSVIRNRAGMAYERVSDKLRRRLPINEFETETLRGQREYFLLFHPQTYEQLRNTNDEATANRKK